MPKPKRTFCEVERRPAPLDFKAVNEMRIAALIDREPDLAVALEACCSERPCKQLICASCSEVARRRFLGMVEALAAQCPAPLKIATVYLKRIPSGALEGVRLLHEHGALRKRLQRAGFGGCLLVGGTELAWHYSHSSWLHHCHLLAGGVPEAAWAQLRTTLRDSGTRAPVRVDELRDAPRQISYLQKFTTYHRPNRRGGQGQSRAVPLPAAQFAELARWWSAHEFEAFPFLFGARRRGTQLVCEV